MAVACFAPWSLDGDEPSPGWAGVGASPCISAPLAGVVADRLPRRRVLLVTQSLLGLLALALGVLVWTGAVTVPTMAVASVDA